MIGLSNLIMQAQGLSTDALAITLGIAFGFVGLAAAIYFGLTHFELLSGIFSNVLAKQFCLFKSYVRFLFNHFYLFLVIPQPS